MNSFFTNEHTEVLQKLVREVVNDPSTYRLFVLVVFVILGLLGIRVGGLVTGLRIGVAAAVVVALAIGLSYGVAVSVVRRGFDLIALTAAKARDRQHEQDSQDRKRIHRLHEPLPGSVRAVPSVTAAAGYMSFASSIYTERAHRGLRSVRGTVPYPVPPVRATR